MRTLLLESVAGIAGDMFAASFVDAGLVDPAVLGKVPRMLGLSGVEVAPERRRTAGMHAMHLDVVVDGGHAHRPHATFEEIDRLLADSDLGEGAKLFARKVYSLLARAESEAHGVEISEVHFHEVGAIDSIVDVAMAGICVSAVAPDGILATPVKLGRGMIRIQHGPQAVPPPASARLAQGFRIADVPDAITEPDVELSTPTGLAILRALQPTFVEGWPAGKVVAQGMGCGTREFASYPNVFRLVLLDERVNGRERATSTLLPYATDRVIEICANLDDQPPERTAWATEQLLEMGALDVWTMPVTGKKGRVSLCMSVLARMEDWTRLADWILRHTSTFGIRHRAWDRLKLERHTRIREVNGEKVAFKIGRTRDGELLKEKPEFDDLRRVWEKET